MLSLDRKPNLPQTDVSMLKIPDLCIGNLTGPAGNISKLQKSQSKRGTEHIKIKSKHQSDSFLEL
jgi:hypothetical protein